MRDGLLMAAPWEKTHNVTGHVRPVKRAQPSSTRREMQPAGE
jgi:hypothetical protein